MLLIERGCPLLEQEAKALLSRTPEWSEAASGPWDAVVRYIIGSDKLANKKALFDQALLIRNVNMAFLILSTLDPDSSDFTEGQVRALLCAAETGDIEIIRQIIENNRQLVNSVDLDGQSVLSKACERGYRKIVQYLLTKGADVKKDTSSPLTFAARAGDEKICGALLARGATVFDRAQVRGKNLLVGQTPLAGVMLSNLTTPEKKEICRLLFDNCEDISSPSMVTIAYEAIVTAAQSELTTEEDIEMIVDLFGIDWSGNTKKDGMNLAMLSVESDNILLVKFFLDSANIDPGELHFEKGTLLCILIEKIRDQEQKKIDASDHFDDSILRSLIGLAIEIITDFPQLINIQRPSDGNSPLMLATHLINAIVIDQLIDGSARLDLINKRGWSVLHCAATTMNRGIIELCLEHNADLCRIKDCDGCLPMHYLAREVTNFDQILELCGDQPLNISDNEGRNILHFAIRNPGNGDLVRTLLQRGFDPIKLVPEVVALEEIQESALTIAVNCLNYRGIVAILEHLPPLEMAVFSTLQELLKPHIHKIIACIKAEAGQTRAKAPTQDKGKSIALERLNRILENGIRLLSLSPEELAELQVVRQSLQPLERVKEGQSTQRGYK